MIFVNGDSFTAGEELPNKEHAWPCLLARPCINWATSGFSNDAIVRTTVIAVENQQVDHAIVAWTTPHRIEVNGQHLTPSSQRKYGSICDHVFLNWDKDWARTKFLTQVLMLDTYLRDRKVPYVFVRTFDVPLCTAGNWVEGSMVEWMGDCPKGPDGHPLALGQQRIAEQINEHIRHLGWVS
jgi:hypothetical protein